MRRLRFQVRRTTRNDKGRSVVMLGVRVGYWPCLEAPFVQVAFGLWLFDLWFGLPSYYSGAAS